MKFTIGFDAYIDKLARVVESRTDCDNYKCYATIEDFGNRVLKMKGLSGDIETITQSIRYGGNAPLMAGALSGLGADVTLVAPVGNSSCFDSIRESTNVINIGEPAESFNLEFDDGKVMMGENSVLNDINLEKLTENGFMDDIMAEFSKSGLIGFVNWSQMEKIIPVYKYIIEKLDDKERILFADLADFSKKPSELSIICFAPLAVPATTSAIPRQNTIIAIIHRAVNFFIILPP